MPRSAAGSRPTMAEDLLSYPGCEDRERRFRMAQPRRQPSGCMAGIDLLRRFLVSLRCHLGRIRRIRHAARPELVALDVVFGAGGLNAVRLTGLGHRRLLKCVARSVHQIPSAFSPASRPGTLT